MDKQIKELLSTYGVPEKTMNLIDETYQEQINAVKDASKEVYEQELEKQKNKMTADQFNSLSYQEKVALYNDNKALYDEMAQG